MEKNIGISILPKIKVQSHLNNKTFSQIKVKGLKLENTNHIVYHKEKTQNETFKELIKIIKSKNI